jgi:hypothetical protein
MNFYSRAQVEEKLKADLELQDKERQIMRLKEAYDITQRLFDTKQSQILRVKIIIPHCHRKSSLSGYYTLDNKNKF